MKTVDSLAYTLFVGIALIIIVEGKRGHGLGPRRSARAPSTTSSTVNVERQSTNTTTLKVGGSTRLALGECLQYISCNSCTSLPLPKGRCGWCAGLKMCLPRKAGTVYGIPPAQCQGTMGASKSTGENPGFFSDSLSCVLETGTSDMCASRDTCSDCIGWKGFDNMCGWCASSQSCIPTENMNKCSWGYRAPASTKASSYSGTSCPSCSMFINCNTCTNTSLHPMQDCQWCSGTCKPKSSDMNCQHTCSSSSPAATTAATSSATPTCGSLSNCYTCQEMSNKQCSWCYGSQTCVAADDVPQICPWDSAPFLPGAPCPDPCVIYQTQGECAAVGSSGFEGYKRYCGWNIYLQKCQFGTEYSPLLNPEDVPPFLTAWFPFQTANANCSAYTDCSQCTAAPGPCGWCPGSKLCTDGTSYGPGNFALCDRYWRFSTSQCASALPVDCSQYETCLSCVSAGGGNRCGFCVSSKTCLPYYSLQKTGGASASTSVGVKNGSSCSGEFLHGTNVTKVCSL